MCGSGDVGGAGCGLSSDTKVKAMKSHALAERIRVETMGLSDSQKSPILRGFQEISDMFPRTLGLEADEANLDIFR